MRNKLTGVREHIYGETPEGTKTQNTLTDLHDCLSEELMRLGDRKLGGEKLAEEIERSRAMTSVAQTIINTGSLVIKAREAAVCMAGGKYKLPPQLTD